MFEAGRLYKRKEDLHGKYGGQAQGGISTPASHDLILVFTSDAGHNYGYEDHFRPDGVFLYTGEGQVGDMEWVRGNVAIRDHAKNGKTLHLFEYIRKAYVRYVGEAICIGSHVEQRPDRNGNPRNAIVFHLSIQPLGMPGIQGPINRHNDEPAPKLKMSLEELRALALKPAVESATKEQLERNTYIRSEAVRLYALKRSNGKCEGCISGAPFIGREGPFLEVHHLQRLSDGGPDHPENVIALCPNCHRRVHCSIDGDRYNQQLITLLVDIERRCT